MMRSKLTIILALMWAWPAWAATYYVAKTGSNSNVGSEAAPWLTIGNAATTMASGDTVYIKAGTYSESINLSLLADNLTFEGYGSDVVIVSGSIAFQLGNRSGLTFRKLRLRGTTQAINAGAPVNLLLDTVIMENSPVGILISGPANGVRMTNCITRNAPYAPAEGDGIQIKTSGAPGARNIRISNHVSHNNYRQGLQTQWTTNLLIENSTWASNGASGIQIETGTKYLHITNCVFHSNTANYPSEMGLWIDETQWGVIEDSSMYDNQRGGWNGQSHYMIWRNNLLYRNKAQYRADATDRERSGGLGVGIGTGTAAGHVGAPDGGYTNRFLHNVLYDNGHSTASLAGGVQSFNTHADLKGNWFLNNIVSHNVIREQYVADRDIWSACDYNVYYHPSRALAFYYDGGIYGWTSWQVYSGWDLHSQATADPLFTDAANADFSLADGSPAIDAGSWLTTTVGSGTGTSMTVADPYVFSYGWGITGVAGDLIQLAGQTTQVRVTGINQASGVLTLSGALTWSAGQGVAYSYTGNGPDIGAIERTTAPSPSEVSLSAPDGTTLREGGSAIRIRISRTSTTSGNLTGTWTIGGTATNGTHYSTFNSNWQIDDGQSYEDVNLTPLDDSTYTGNLTFTLTINSGGGYSVAGGALVITRLDAQQNPALTTGRDPSGQGRGGRPL